MESKDFITWLIGGVGTLIVYRQYRTTTQYAKENLALQQRLEQYSTLAQIQLTLAVMGAQVSVTIANLSSAHSVASYHLTLTLEGYAASGAVRVAPDQLVIEGGILLPNAVEKVISDELNRYLSYVITPLRDEPSELDRLVIRAYATCSPPQKGAGKIRSSTAARLAMQDGTLQVIEQADYLN